VLSGRRADLPILAAGQPAGRAGRIRDALVVDAIREACWKTGPDGRRRLTPEGLYGRRKLTAYLRRTSMPEVAECTVARGMKTLGHKGITRAKGIRTTIPAKGGKRAGELLNRNFTAPAPNRTWVTDFVLTRHVLIWQIRAPQLRHSGRSVQGLPRTGRGVGASGPWSLELRH
jgi:hypothetical protein